MCSEKRGMDCGLGGAQAPWMCGAGEGVRGGDTGQFQHLMPVLAPPVPKATGSLAAPGSWRRRGTVLTTPPRASGVPARLLPAAVSERELAAMTAGLWGPFAAVTLRPAAKAALVTALGLGEPSAGVS